MTNKDHIPSAPFLELHGNAVALEDGKGSYSFAQLRHFIEALRNQLRGQGSRVVATLMDNGVAWVVSDFAIADAGLVHVPLAGFFTSDQISHALRSAGVDTVLTIPEAAARWPQLPSQEWTVAGQTIAMLRLPALPAAMPAGTSKVTFTSGTTGAPKGVCLTQGAMASVADGLVAAMTSLPIKRHLCALPFAVLLENIAGLWAPLMRGATCLVPSSRELGLAGSSSFDAQIFHTAIERLQPNSIILLPQMLRAWTAFLMKSGRRAPPCLAFVAVGGAAVGTSLLEMAASVGIPAFEGYGLSEGASVQTLNLPGFVRAGSAGRVLPQSRIRISATGEIEVSGTLFAGYLGDSSTVAPWWSTGDLGSIDEDGYLFVQGRSKNVLITGFGRNVSPEWVETALCSQAAIAQAVVLGNDQPKLGAVLWPVSADTSDEALQAAIALANRGLPDYARIGAWARADVPFDVANGMATANGRPRRQAVEKAYAPALGFQIASPGAPAEDLPVPFHVQLIEQTAEARMGLLSIPIIQGCLRGEVSLPSYQAFLQEAFHHVRHTVPLMRACKASLPERNRWLEPALDEYVEEEIGHDEWILDDIAMSGKDAEAVRHGAPGLATEIMVAYAYDTIARRNPLGLFGMVHVLEGTSVSLALMAADQIQKSLGLPDSAFSYLRSHGTLDKEHVGHFEDLMNSIHDPQDQADIIHCAKAFYRLYGDVFRSIPLPEPASAAMHHQVGAHA